MIVGAEKTSAAFGIVNPNPIVLMSKNNDRAIESDSISKLQMAKTNTAVPT